jgi:UDP-glucose 4-epimerase
MDIAKGHLAALDFTNHKAGWDVINLGTGEGISVLEIINEFERASGKKIPYSIENRRAGDVASCYASADKALKVLNWRTQYAPKEMCASAWIWEQNNCRVDAD